MAAIDTYVFLDIKTIELPADNINETEMTQLSLVAVKRSHILEPPSGDTPRVQQKLTLHFNSCRMQPNSTNIAGLCNDLWEYDSPFNEAVFDTINSFLNFLSKPVCLVASGITDDFQILKKYLIGLNLSFSHDLLCVNCVHYFYDIDTKLVDVATKVFDEETSSYQNIVDEQDSTFDQEIKNIQTQNESTPKKSDNTNINKPNVPTKRKVNAQLKEISKIRRRLSFGDDIKPQKFYKLKDIYNAHSAENNCIMALKWSMVRADQFVQFVDNNHCLFADV